MNCTELTRLPLLSKEPRMKIVLIIIAALCSHLAVVIFKLFVNFLSSRFEKKAHPKILSFASLLTSTVIFLIYFSAFGFILHELGVSLTAYLASASVIGLAVAFGSQGLVQDLVTGLTLVFSDLVDVGDIVEIGGQTGIIRSTGMRFIVLENFSGAEISIPNRSITNVINYREGYVRCIVDAIVPGPKDLRKHFDNSIRQIASSMFEQFPNIIVEPPIIQGRKLTLAGKEFARIEFRIWPGRGALIEDTFKKELVQALKTIDPSYSDWMVAVYYDALRQLNLH